jgi:hypothetical protein
MAGWAATTAGKDDPLDPASRALVLQAPSYRVELRPGCAMSP